MTARSSINLDVSPDCSSAELQHYVSQTTATVNTTINVQDIQGGTQIFPAPIFNIHVHVPPTVGKNVQVYLPRIKPVIHLHFEELAKKLELHDKTNEDATYRVFRNLLSMSSPQFGNVLFHQYNERNEGVIIQPDVIQTIPISPQNNCTDIALENQPNGICGYSDINELSEMENSYGREKSPGKKITRSRIRPRKSVKRHKPNLEKPNKCPVKEEFKLKKAVVILTDICKTKYFRDMVAAKKIWLQDNNNDECSGALGERSCLGKQEREHLEHEDYERISIKQEIDTLSPESPTSVTERKFEISESSQKEMESPNSTAKNDNLASTRNSLTALAEGCNFSEILSRFRLKYPKQYLMDSLGCLDKANTGECSTPLRCSTEDWHTTQNTRECNEVYIPKEEFVPDEGGYAEETFNNDSENSLKITDMRIPPESQSDGLQEAPSSSKSDSESDTEKIHSVIKSRPTGVIVNSSEAETISSCTSPYLVPISRFKYIENKEKNINDVWNFDFQLDLINKEMKRRGLENTPSKGENVIKKAAPENKSPSAEDPSPRKRKRSESRNETEMTVKVEEADYIPLQANGPTKFAVAPLDKVSSYKNHPARNFKEEMLFGNRVNRFSNSQKLRVYQLKQTAVREQVKLRKRKR